MSIVLMAIDPGLNTGITLFDTEKKILNQYFLTYSNSKELFKHIIEDLQPVLDKHKPTHFVLEFTRFSKALHSTLSHFGIIGILYYLINKNNIKWLNGMDKSKDSWGCNPSSINAWCAEQIGVTTGSYGDKESIQFADRNLKRLKKDGWKLDREEFLCKNNEHVADSLGIGLYCFAHVLKEVI